MSKVKLVWLTGAMGSGKTTLTKLFLGDCRKYTNIISEYGVEFTVNDDFSVIYVGRLDCGKKSLDSNYKKSNVIETLKFLKENINEGVIVMESSVLSSEFVKILCDIGFDWYYVFLDTDENDLLKRLYSRKKSLDKLGKRFISSLSKKRQFYNIYKKIDENKRLLINTSKYTEKQTIEKIKKFIGI